MFLQTRCVLFYIFIHFIELIAYILENVEISWAHEGGKKRQNIEIEDFLWSLFTDILHILHVFEKSVINVWFLRSELIVLKFIWFFSFIFLKVTIYSSFFF